LLLTGSSAASLHAKTFAVDGERIFIGSFNLDPRSAALNTELGFVIESPRLANALGEAFLQAIPKAAYEVRKAPGGALVWIDRSSGTDRILTTEPDSGMLQRALVRMMSWLPIEWML
jgi:putative cardiolipin synthase